MTPLRLVSAVLVFLLPGVLGAQVPNPVDRAVEADLAARGTALTAPCSDAVYLRRVFLDLAGTLPTRAETEDFLADRSPEKRARLVEALFQRDEYADFFSLHWADLLRVKSEFPINLWPNAVQAYHRWIREAVRTNLPYDRFATELLTSSGSNVRVPAVNFYRAVPNRTPEALGRAVAQVFLGTNADLAPFFSRVAYKKTLEWKEEIVLNQPAPSEPLTAQYPDGTTVTFAGDQDPRPAFARWLTTPANPWFARAAVVRLWSWTSGGDLGGEAGGPAPNQALLGVLQDELISSGWDQRAVLRLILASKTYQQLPLVPASDAPGADYARYQVRRLDAEVLADALASLAGKGEVYTSPIPEPFTFVPATQRSTALADGSISSSFLARFGRPARDTGLASERNNHPTSDQVLYLLNSSEVKKKLDKSPVLKDAYGLPASRRAEQVRRIYLTLLSRPPTAAEVAACADAPAPDIAWALVNGKEFLYRH